MGTWAHDGLIDTHQRVIKPIRFNHSKNYIQDSYSIYLSYLIHMGENRKSYTFFPINSILGMTKQTLILFLEASIGPFFGSFLVMLYCISPTNMWRVKGTLSIIILFLSLLELEFCHSRNLKNFQKHKIVHDYQVFWIHSFNVYNGLIMNSWTPLLKTKHRLYGLKKFFFFFRSDKNLKVARKCMI